LSLLQRVDDQNTALGEQHSYLHGAQGGESIYGVGTRVKSEILLDQRAATIKNSRSYSYFACPPAAHNPHWQAS
jgi:hypothetical protein